QQVKIRGHRIEPAEVEAALAAVDGVGQAAVVAERGASGGELIARITGTADVERWRASLQARLPDYQVPARTAACDRLPMTSNGKLDRAALRARAAPPASAAFVEPGTERERLLAGIWRDVLGVDRVGRHDRFVSLGGDSIKSIQILARLRA